MILRTFVRIGYAALLIAPAAEPRPHGTESGPKLELHAVEQKVLAETNRQRVRLGLRPLRVDAPLMQSARRHTAWMARRCVLQHTSAAVAENIALGQRSAKEVLRSWMSSSGHRANILNPSYRRIGVAAYRGADGRVYWCQQFAR